jgi:hypothetical protein
MTLTQRSVKPKLQAVQRRRQDRLTRKGNTSDPANDGGEISRFEGGHSTSPETFLRKKTRLPSMDNPKDDKAAKKNPDARTPGFVPSMLED